MFHGRGRPGMEPQGSDPDGVLHAQLAASRPDCQDFSEGQVEQQGAPMLHLTQLSNHLTCIWQILEGSFSAVSKPNFAIKYSLESSWRDLSYFHSFAPLRPQEFIKTFSDFEKLANGNFCNFCRDSCWNLTAFYWNFTDYPENAAKCRKSGEDGKNIWKELDSN